MESLIMVFMYIVMILVISCIIYFVIKKAILDALKEYNNNSNK